jgi:alpha/beta superfamily hydrolase
MNIQYGANTRVNGQSQNLLLDIYEPSGDVETARPLILIAHGGSFIGGSKTGPDVVPLCHDFAKMGYVVASVEYRLGIANFPFPGPDSTDASEAVMRATQDARAAVRFFRKNVITGGNTYGIDTNNIYFAGVSAGAFMALHLAYLEDPNELPVYIDTTQIGLSGGMEGNSGNQGYNSDVRAIINICGALGDTAWMHAGDEPVCSFHGTNDGTVPYGSAVITLIGVYPLLQVDGSFSVSARAADLGIENCFETHEGQDHVPHVGNAQYYDTTRVIMRNFLSHFVCGNSLECFYNYSVAVNEHNPSDSDINLYPNPANSEFRIQNSEFKIQEVELFDVLGKSILKRSGLEGKSEISIDVAALSSGIYMVKLISSDRVSFAKLVRE